MLLQDRIVVVSGIGPGMGRDVSLACAREGADLVLAARSGERLQAVAEEVRSLGRRALAVATDIAEPDDCRRLSAAAHAEFGRIDVLVNNAFRGGLEPTIAEADLDSWRKIFDVNVFGSVRLSQSVVPYMKEQGGGSIIFVNSMSMRIIEPHFGGYAASKGALMIAAQTLARELGVHKIRVNSVVPGYIWGEALERYFVHLGAQRGTTPEQVYAEIASRTALNHIPTSAEIADAVVFFASDLARAITGQALDVNGGHFFH
jgi:NAD(P)-dependent dehydrogenase (short-subunit alcohol dehydrogenase family)